MTNSSFANPSTDNQLIPRSVLFGNPDKMSVTLSPNGKYISYIAPLDGVLNVYVAPAEDLSSAKPITKDKERGIRSYRWAYDNKHILYTQDEKGDENTRIYSYNLDTAKTKLLTPEKDIKAFIQAVSPHFPDQILISLNERRKDLFDIYRLNLNSNKIELMYENDKFAGFILDHDLKIRFGSLINEEAETEYHEFKGDKLSLFMTLSLEDSENTDILGFNKTGDAVYLSDSRERDTAALKTLNLNTKAETLIATSDKADVGIFTVKPLEYKIQGTVVNYDKPTVKIIDEEIKPDYEYLRGLDKGELHINTRTLDDKKWLVAYSSDVAPVKYYLYDRKSKKAKFLFTNKKDLEQYTLASMQPVVIKSRDGLDLVSYLTLPQGAKEPLPMVLYVHGGPWARDYWGYNSVHQWLSNRGYGVLSVNYRMSTGFGKKFANAGNLQWGKKMHDDLIDAVNWAIDQKIADPRKIAIMGGSYGGYATLVGLTFTPDVFACGIDIVGPSNLITLVKTVPPYWKPVLNIFKKRMGSWDTNVERKKLDEVSPLHYVDNIKKPLFIAQGKHDPRVKQSESDQIVQVMQAKNIPVLYALYEDEGHGFARPENRLSFYAMSEKFLAKILGGRAEEIDNDFEGAKFYLNDKKVNNKEAEKLIDNSITGESMKRN